MDARGVSVWARPKYVFPSVRTRARCMSENTVNAALRRLGYSKEEMTGHGFRSIASTLLHEHGQWSSEIIERQLAHGERNKVKAAYNRAQRLTERRSAVLFSLTAERRADSILRDDRYAHPAYVKRVEATRRRYTCRNAGGSQAMLNIIGDWLRARRTDADRRHLIRCELNSPVKASLLSLAPNSDLRRWCRWADQCPPHLRELPADIPDDVPYRGLRNYWYPVMPAKDLRQNQLVPFRLLGDDLVFFRTPDGTACALDDVCPHRRARLSLGWINLHAPGTVTCPYHGWTFDRTGQCTAALAEGPDSPLPAKVKTRVYPVVERHHLIWVYMGDSAAVPALDDNIPHADAAMAGAWPWFIHWDWPVNYLNALDNDADPAHANFAHARCAQFLDQGRWDKFSARELDCGGLEISIKGQGQPHRGPRSASAWEMHVPGYIYFAPSPPKWPAGAIFWAVPIDEGNMRMFTFATFHGAFRARAWAWVMQSLYWRRWGLPNNIYHCNRGPDRAMVMSQGRLADWRLERLSQSDLPVIRFRKKMKQALAAERTQLKLTKPSQKLQRS